VGNVFEVRGIEDVSTEGRKGRELVRNSNELFTANGHVMKKISVKKRKEGTFGQGCVMTMK